jgi:hypothetical protein
VVILESVLKEEDVFTEEEVEEGAVEDGVEEVVSVLDEDAFDEDEFDKDESASSGGDKLMESHQLSSITLSILHFFSNQLLTPRGTIHNGLLPIFLTV